MLGGPAIKASQVKMSSSERGPAVIPSGEEAVRDLYSENRRREASVDAMTGERKGGWCRT